MSVQAVVMMVVVLCLTWGLFAALLVLARRFERGKGASARDREAGT